jgi:hypothetical protein
MSASNVARKTIERRARSLPWGIQVEIWEHVDTRTYPKDAARLPISCLFDEDDDSGALPAAEADDEDTLEMPSLEETTRETPFAPDQPALGPEQS